MFNTSLFTANSEHLYLEIPNTSKIREHSYSTPGGDRRAWLNQLCLQAFLPWFREEIASDAKLASPRNTLPSFWEVVNGTAITFGRYRLVLIPTLAIDNDELRVPQEWIDIPEWIADYYVAVQVNPDDGWIEICGYATHHQLKTEGAFDFGDRSYSLEADDLIQDLNVLWVTHQVNSPGILRAEVRSLTPIAATQAENLLTRLGDSQVKFPRLSVPFALWGALLAKDSWREQLSQLRQGRAVKWSVSQWLQAGVDSVAQQWGWSKKELVVVPVEMRSVRQILGLSRQLAIAGNLYELRIFPTSQRDNLVWRFELHGTIPEQQIPAGFKLRLLTEDLQPFENNEDIAQVPLDLLYLEVILEPGEALVWETEPEADDYQREVLWF